MTTPNFFDQNILLLNIILSLSCVKCFSVLYAVLFKTKTHTSVAYEQINGSMKNTPNVMLISRYTHIVHYRQTIACKTYIILPTNAVAMLC